MKQKVAVVGLGYVGLPVAVLAADKGFEVHGLDINQEKVAQINDGQLPIDDKFAEKRFNKGDVTAATDPGVVENCQIIIIAVPTPIKDGYQPDLGPLKSACASIAPNLQKDSLVIIESTMNPGVSEEILIPLLEEETGYTCGEDFYLSHCPERINPGDETWTVANIPRVVGSINQAGLDKTVDFYNQLLDAEVKPMGGIKEAEAVKVVENTFRDVNIAFVNELAMSFSKLNINVKNVIDGAATKPFAFMPHYPGAGVGGHCIPVDPYYLIEYAKDFGFDHDFLTLARKINSKMPEFTISQLMEGLNEAGLALSQSNVAVLGLSYKPNVGDDRESPSYELLKLLQAKKVGGIKVFDPYVNHELSTESLDQALESADAAVLATAHDEFLNIDYSQKDIGVLVDGRNALSKFTDTENLVYRGIGT